MIELLIGFAGALVGSGASLGGMYLQTRVQNNRERLRLAAELARDEFNRDYKVFQELDPPASMPPLVSYIQFHLDFGKELEKGDISEEKIHELVDKHKRIKVAYAQARERYFS